MQTRRDDVDAYALRKQGWTISAVARHLDHDRKTIRVNLTGERVAGPAVRILPALPRWRFLQLELRSHV